MICPLVFQEITIKLTSIYIISISISLEGIIMFFVDVINMIT